MITLNTEGWNKLLELQDSNTDVFIYVDFSMLK